MTSAHPIESFAKVGAAVRGEFPIFETATYLNSCSQGALSHRVREALRRSRQRIAAAQHLRSQQVRCQVAVTHAKPVFAAVPRNHVQIMERVPGNPPTHL